MNKNLIAVCVENIFVTVCFTLLAIHFDKWWIVLFSILFYSSYRLKGGGTDG